MLRSETAPWLQYYGKPGHQKQTKYQSEHHTVAEHQFLLVRAWIPQHNPLRLPQAAPSPHHHQSCIMLHTCQLPQGDHITCLMVTRCAPGAAASQACRAAVQDVVRASAREQLHAGGPTLRPGGVFVQRPRGRAANTQRRWGEGGLSPCLPLCGGEGDTRETHTYLP
jgi:hypothetical protein